MNDISYKQELHQVSIHVRYPGGKALSAVHIMCRHMQCNSNQGFDR